MLLWKKLGNIFDPTQFPRTPWRQEFAQAPATLQYDDFVRIFYSCRPPRDSAGQYTSNTSWVDVDKSDIRKVLRISDKPIMPLGDVGAFDEFGIYPASPIRDGNKVLLFYGGWTRCESVPFNVSIGLAISDDDGETFRRHGPGPILSYSLDEPFVISGPKVRKFNGLFYLFYIAGRKWILDNGSPEPVYKIRMAFSSDGLTWTRCGKDLVPDKLDDEEAQASPDVFFSDGRYHMFFCYRFGRNYRNPSRGYRIGYAYSKDLVEWIRDDKMAGLLPSNVGWDSESVSYPHVAEIEGKTIMFYLGNSVGRWGFGAAELVGTLS